MRDRDDGFAMMAVILGMGALLLLVVLVFQQSTAEYGNAQYSRRDDTILAGADAMLERYASKLTIDPLYYIHYVDEAELPRRCTDSASLYNGFTQSPGEPWYQDCGTWEYEPPDSFFDHPLLDGRAAIDADDIAALLTVAPPTADAGLEVTVVARQSEFGQTRAISAEVRPQSISEFAFLVEGELRFGSGAEIRGKIYTGDNLGFVPTPVQGIVYRDVFAEGRIGGFSGYGPPVFADGAGGYDGIGEYDDIRDLYPEPLAFSNFWDDLDLIRAVACGGGGLCLSRTDNPSLGLADDPTAWLLEPYVAGGTGRIRVYAAYETHSYSCVSSEEWWWLDFDAATWEEVGTFNVPVTGAVWADNHVILGRPGSPTVIKGQVTIYAGSGGSRKNIVIGADMSYAGGTSGNDVLGLIASDEIIISPLSVGGDEELHIAAAFLTQGGVMRTARDCGDSGDPVLPDTGGIPDSELFLWGSRAHVGTGDMAAHFSPRHYDFDPRLEALRPPLFPLMKDEWDYSNWREIFVPCWAKDEGCAS